MIAWFVDSVNAFSELHRILHIDFYAYRDKIIHRQASSYPTQTVIILLDFLEKETTMTPELRFCSYTEMDERFAPVLDCGELVAVGDYVRVWLPGSDSPIYGDVIALREDIQYAQVEGWNGAQRWVSLDEMTLILKGTAQELKSAPAFQSA